ncbi:MAG: hypothetical protein JNL83_06660 [Myxococcales bacterium]|nr:hypothetical protein [Myxococcales bacterium]
MNSFTKYLAAAALFAAVTVHAQGADPAKPAAPAPKPAVVNLSVTEMKDRARAFDAQLLEDSRHIAHLRDIARKQKDVIKLTCVNDKLVELKAQMNLFDTSRQRFTATVDGGGTADAARPSYVELADLAEKVKLLRGEADTCIGTPDLYKQEAGVEVTHPDFPDDPTVTDPFVPPEGAVEPPAYASPFG